MGGECFVYMHSSQVSTHTLEIANFIVKSPLGTYQYEEFIRVIVAKSCKLKTSSMQDVGFS